MDSTTTVPSQTPLPTPPAEPTRWHLIVGIIGLIYGILGMGMYVIGALWIAFMPRFMAMMGFKDLPSMPNAWFVVGSMIVTMIVGIALILGCIKMIRRDPTCVGMLQFWVAARLVLLVIGFVATFLMMPSQLAFGKATDDAIRAALEERQPGASKNMPPYDMEKQATMARYGMLGSTAVVLAFPLFLGILLTNKKKRAEIEAWRDLPRI